MMEMQPVNTALSSRSVPRRGGILPVVLIVGVAFSLAIGTMLPMLNNESRMNVRSQLLAQTDYAVYSLVELGLQQVRQRVMQIGTPTTGWQPTLVVSTTAFNDFIDGSAGAAISTTAGDVELIGGAMPTVSQKWYDPSNPDHLNDSMLGMWCSFYEIPVYGKVRMVRPDGIEITRYGSATIEVRSAPMFMYAAFFNMDLEAFAGGDMILNGRVHANGNFSISSDNGSGSARQVMYDNVTVSGIFDDDPFFGNNNRGQTMIRSNAGTWISTMNQAVSWTPTAPGMSGSTIVATSVSTGGAAFSALQSGTNSTNHLYSEDQNWYELALNNWGGRIKTDVHGVGTRKVAGMEEYTPSNDHSSIINTAYQIIQPVRQSDNPDLIAPSTGDTDYATRLVEYEENWTRERQKFSYRSGLILEVSGTTISQSNTFKVGTGSSTTTTTFTTLDPATATVSAFTYQRDAAGNVLYDAATGEPLKTVVGLPSDLITVEAHSFGTHPSDGSTVVASGLTDNRRNRNVNLVKVDVRRLRDLIDNHGAAGGTEFVVNPSTFWNGGVYIQFPDAGSARSSDGVQPGVDGWGVYLHNAENAAGDPALPTGGLTIATNNVVYVAGNYNADGSIDVHSNSTPEAEDRPAAVAADAVVLLSSNWEDQFDAGGAMTFEGNWRYSNDGRQPQSNRPGSTTKNRRATHTEYSLAILAGQVPRNKVTETGTQSNSTLANYLRFLEDWQSGAQYASVRGSIVALFECEIARQHLPGHTDIYLFPGRHYGFNTLFSSSQPPLSPTIIDFKKIRYRVLDAAEYEAAVAGLR